MNPRSTNHRRDQYTPLLPCIDNINNPSMNILGSCISQFPAELQKGFDVHSKLPLHNAAANIFCIETFRLLLHRYPNAAKERDNHGNLPLHLTLSDSNQYNTVFVSASKDSQNKAAQMEKIALLIDAYPGGLLERNHAGHLPLEVACQNRLPLATIQSLMEKGPANLLLCGDVSGQLPLHKVCQWKCCLDLILAVLEGSATPASEKDDMGQLPLHKACQSDWGMDMDVIKHLLVKYPAGIQQPDYEGNIPLHAVLQNTWAECDKVMFMLEKCPSSLKHKNNAGRLPLHSLAARNRGVALPRIVTRYIIKHYRAAVRMKDVHGNLPLHLSAGNRHATDDLIEQLIQQYPASLNSKNCLGDLPLHIACKTHRHGTVQNVLPFITNTAVQKTDGEGRLPLHLACRSKFSLETVKLFLTIHPGNPNVLDKKGNLPLFYACEQSASLDVIYLLTANSTDWLVNAAQLSATQRNPI